MSDNASVSPEALFALPEKVLQFGTGVLLRGLPDYFIDKANKKGIFNGRIVVVKSTNAGGTDTFKQQEGLYTLLERGFENGVKTERQVINASISRVLSAADEWQDILACAENPDMQIVLSNTTEVGITLVTADAHAARPVSFPGKLLAFLWKRYAHFKGDDHAGMIIIPTELIPDNGSRLKAIVTELARLKGADPRFIEWLHHANDFCNSLVDRIVPGKLNAQDAAVIEKQLGYSDELMVTAECYRLWAIETSSSKTKKILSFSEADAGVIIERDINKFRELKLRLLNATHTFSCGLAFLAGFGSVKEAMKHEVFLSYITNLMLQEIVPLVVSEEITKSEAEAFAWQVIDRFRNPYIEHLWQHIAVQYTSKMAVRGVPLLQKHYAVGTDVPELMALGFAAYILYMRAVMVTRHEEYEGQSNGSTYRILDDKADVLYEKWNDEPAGDEARRILGTVSLWGTDLSRYAGFAAAVNTYLVLLMETGVTAVLQSLVQKMPAA